MKNFKLVEGENGLFIGAPSQKEKTKMVMINGLIRFGFQKN